MEMSQHFRKRDLLKFSLPTICMMIVSSIYGVIDGLFISNVEGDTAFSAVNLIIPFVMVLGVFGFMFGSGGSALVSKTFGEGDIQRGNRYFTMNVITLIIISLSMSIIGFFLIEPMSRLLGANEAMLPYCLMYGKALVPFVLFFSLQYSFQSYMVVAKKTLLNFIFTLIAGLTNVLGDFLLVYVFKYGVIGAAIASGISAVIGSILPISYLIIYRHKNTLKFVPTKLEAKALIQSSSNGLSEMVSNVSMSLVNMLYNAQLMLYIGQDGVTAYGIIMYVGFIFTGVYFGFSMSVAPLISYQYGANNNKELQSLLKNSLLIYILFALVLSTAAILSSSLLASAFIRDNDTLLELSSNALKLYSISYYLAGFNIFFSAFFTALNNGFVSGFISLARTFIFQVICIYVLPLIFKEAGLWLSMSVSEVFSLGVSLFFLFKKKDVYHYFNNKKNA